MGEHNSSQSNICPIEPRYYTTTGPEYLNVTEAKEMDPKTNCMNMEEILKEKRINTLKKSRKIRLEGMNKSIQESQENTNNWRKLINTLKKAKKKKPNS